jgi:hypothetical protein
MKSRQFGFRNCNRQTRRIGTNQMALPLLLRSQNRNHHLPLG